MSKTDALRVQDYLAHIVEAIDRMGRYVVDMVELCFLSDEKTQDAVVVMGGSTRGQCGCVLVLAACT